MKKRKNHGVMAGGRKTNIIGEPKVYVDTQYSIDPADNLDDSWGRGSPTKRDLLLDTIYDYKSSPPMLNWVSCESRNKELFRFEKYGRSVEGALLEKWKDRSVTADIGVQKAIEELWNKCPEDIRREVREKSRAKSEATEAKSELMHVPLAPDVRCHLEPNKVAAFLPYLKRYLPTGCTVDLTPGNQTLLVCSINGKRKAFYINPEEIKILLRECVWQG